jgi:ribosomal protein L11 methyltransferase
MAYFEYEIPARSWSTDQREIVVGMLAQIGFEGFVEGDDIIQAYIHEEHHAGLELNRIIDQLADQGIHVQYRFHKSADQNWNEEWEKKFEPVVVEDKVLIRAPFHDTERDLPYTLIIEPKMSFGTGHHHTTRLMILEMLDLDMEGRRILDMGCGTGILGIFAAKMGAGRVLGIDIDQWAYENAMENVERNGVSSMEVRLGDITQLGSEDFDIILANITRNTLVRDMSAYVSHLDDQGVLVVSGILAEDVQYILNAAYQNGLNHRRTREESNWLSLSFRKQKDNEPRS